MPVKVKSESSRTQIDVLIPAIEKDLETLPHVIDGIRKQVRHPIGQIMIVAPNRERIVELCRRKNCRFVDENKVLPITKKNINYRSKKWERSGWLFQQLLKMNGDTLGNSDYFLVIDADTVLITPHVFTEGDKTIFYCRNWSQPEYFRTYRKLLGKNPSSRSSFVTHYMLFNKSKLAQLKRRIESKHQKSWYSAIMSSMDKSKQFAFSEFETYGNFLYSMNPSGIILKKARNKSLHANAGQISTQRVATLAKKYRSLSFHKRKGYVRKTGVSNR
ncbi:hypothetical protein SAMN04488542_1578 [Fontibacillus panacisegetis]|uniref:Glycosyl transferase family 8 n=1 Tax=Fontibacillus panacisegetis TaxID=670482 RepID=A0A1G7V4K0_9BACL|nr:DUF6492 family protein [Fontibacillus panacisegetis]SDG54441.1 hypothetical protein SAMN04488542_1578 [Fontibacillus panacisegetis]